MIPVSDDWGDPDLVTARARERLLSGEIVLGGPRGAILSSWQRCQLLAINPDRWAPPYEADLDLDAPLVRAAGPTLDWLQSRITGTRARVSLADSQGRKLLRRVGEASLAGRLDAVSDAPGFCFAEHTVGTNGIGLALVERRPCHVLGAEHFTEHTQRDACVSVPIRNPLDGHLEGVIDFACDVADVTPEVEYLMYEAGHAIERRILEQASERERALLGTYVAAERRVHALARSAGTPVAPGALPGGGGGHEAPPILLEKAAELVGAGRRAAVEVPLGHGLTATLLCRPLVTPSGVAGFAVEALFPDGPLQYVTPSTPDTAGARQPGGPPRASADIPPAPRPRRPDPASYPMAGTPGMPDATGPTAPRRTTGVQLISVGEQGIGRLAVASRRRLRLLIEAAAHIGTTLDVTRTAEELVRAAVPELADLAMVDLAEPVLRGEEPGSAIEAGTMLRRTALHGFHEGLSLYPVGHVAGFLATTPQARCLAAGRGVLEADLRAAPGWKAQDPERVERILAQGVHSLITVPLIARGVTLGVASFYRRTQPEPYEEDDAALASELATRAALCLDNARRYTRERATALTLQRSLLPRELPEQTAVEVAHRYLPARADVGGDWFDVIPLSGARVALVVGDVVGHGLHAAVTMGRLRTAVHSFATLDLAPDELLARLDDLVIDFDRSRTGGPDDAEIIGATCLYAVYDPVSQSCTLARAAHPPPVVVLPDGTVETPDLPVGPPLGLGGLPFETGELHLPEGSQLVLYSDGLIEDRDRDIDDSLDLLHRALAHPDRTPERTCRAVLDALPTPDSSDDVTLLVARTRALPLANIARWDVPDDPAAVSDIRAAALRQLSEWGLDEAAFTTELVLSELVSNAIRHAKGPIQVRLLRDRTLICEVSDGSSTAPHLRHAADTDEGGRGLFLVAQLADRWGTRYTAHGKVIWASQPIDRHD
ncbi:SpoIIE family protein phosphatase [Streptomyces sp. NBC_01622]|uniref:SpoIIE family protein phosphatase n=1 Tax=Streptomyces sp. NBC_01622 TaxID=2975903 RepID=UPI00386434FA